MHVLQNVLLEFFPYEMSHQHLAWQLRHLDAYPRGKNSDIAQILSLTLGGHYMSPKELGISFFVPGN